MTKTLSMPVFVTQGSAPKFTEKTITDSFGVTYTLSYTAIELPDMSSLQSKMKCHLPENKTIIKK